MFVDGIHNLNDWSLSQMEFENPNLCMQRKRCKCWAIEVVLNMTNFYFTLYIFIAIFFPLNKLITFISENNILKGNKIIIWSMRSGEKIGKLI